MPSTDPNVFETANAGFAQALYEQYLKDPGSVSPEWRQLFEGGRIGVMPMVGSGNGGNGSDVPAPTVAVPSPAATARAAPSHGHTAALKSPAARLVQNMTESLSVPTATTFREIAVATLEAARTRFNGALKQAGRPEKASFTHFIAWALVQAAKRHPVMLESFTLVGGGPHRASPGGNHLALGAG